MSITIPLLVPDMPDVDELLPWLRQIDNNRWYTNYGPLNTQFEKELLPFVDGTGSSTLTTVSNCTVGLELVLDALQLPPGSQVLIPAITFVATASAVYRAGLKPLLGDIAADNWLLTPELAQRALAKHSFAAVMPVSAFGCAQDIAGWDRFTASTGIPVVVDAASAFGNQRTGQTTSLVFSLHATKAMGVGEGGIVASQDAELVARVRRASNFGIDLDSPFGNAVSRGTNAKLSEYHAAVGLAALPRWQSRVSMRAELFATYRKELESSLGERVRFQRADDTRVHSLLAIRLVDCADIQRIMATLAQQGIGARRWYCPPLSHHCAFMECVRVDRLTQTERLGRELIGLPFYLGLATKQIKTVTRCVAQALASE